MSAQAETGYMLIFRGTDWFKSLSPEEMQKVTELSVAWINRLKDEGKAISGNPLERDCKIVFGTNELVIADGPFGESNEAIGGYLVLQVKTLSQAAAVAKEFPGLAYGAKVEVRPVARECPIVEEARVEA